MHKNPGESMAGRVWLALVLLWLLAVCLPGATGLIDKPRLPTDDERPQAQQVAPGAVPEGLSLREWTQIQARLRAARYHFRSGPETGADSALPVTASNPRHRLALSLDETGATLSPHAGDWQLGLRTRELGRAAHMEAVVYQAPTYEEARSDIAYDSHPGISEWYDNGPKGIEHGWTLAGRPAGSGEVLLQVSVKGFRVEQAADGQALAFYNGQTSLGYNKLQVFDAGGKPLPARMRPAGDGLLIAFDDSAASYPVTVDPLIVSEGVKLAASDAESQDRLGSKVAISGDIVVAGTIFENELGTRAGAAYVFQRNKGGPEAWGQVVKLIAGDGQEEDRFGISVAASGDTVVVGANLEDEGGNNAGAAYVFQRHAGGPDNWGQVAKLIAGDATGNEQFGFSVAVSGNTVVVGAFGDDERGSIAGASYVFERDAGGPDNWGQVAKLTASDATVFDEFGKSVAISGDTVVVGAHLEDEGGNNAGAAYVFKRHLSGPEAWGEVAKLIADDSEAEDRFGISVAVSGDTVVVGGGVEGAFGSWAAYVFQRHAGGPDNWGQVKKLLPADAEDNDAFGISISVSGDIAVVGARLADAAGINTGAAYVFERNVGGPDNWGQAIQLTAFDATAGDEFGTGVAISGFSIVGGAPRRNETTNDDGALYVFNISGGNYPQAAKLTADDALANDLFGFSVAVDGDIVAVGAKNKKVGPFFGAGAAYVLQRHAGGPDNWGQVAKLTAADAQANASFGSSVTLDGDTVVVGAFLEDEGGPGAGAAYVFSRNEGGDNSWGQVKKLLASDPEDNDGFGFSVSMSGDIMVVGASSEDEAGNDAGAAYVFQRHAGGTDNWGQVAKLTAADPAAGDNFGIAVAAIGDTVVVGADKKNLSAGAVYIFQRHEGGEDNWGQVAKLTVAGIRLNFGSSVALDGDTLLVGAQSEGEGRAYVFQRHQGGPDNWGQVAKLAASDAESFDRFGFSVTISGNTAVIGAKTEDEAGNDAGAAYVFQRHAGSPDNWGQIGKLTANDAEAGDRFGESVASSNGTVVVGAFTEDEAGNDAGAAYVFSISFEDVDFGDAPQDGTRYPVTRANGAGGHIATGPLLGSVRDSELDGLPTANADGDDLDNQLDEDGATSGPLVIDATNSITVTSSESALLSLWIDLNGDGEWSFSERLLDNFITAGGTEDIDIAIPGSATPGDSYARLRISSGGQATPSGVIADGEVEDYLVSLILPTLSIGDAVLTEGNSGQQNLSFTVTLSQAVSQDVTFDFATVDDSATTADDDYVETSGMGTISGGSTSTTINVPVSGDTKFENDESFNVTLSNPSGATIADGTGVGTINNDDTEPSVTLGSDVTEIAEAGGVATLTATLSNASFQPVTVDLGFTGSATNGSDYNPSASQIVIPADSLSGSITQTAVQDNIFEGDETILTDITGVTNGAEDGAQQTTVTITDDDSVPTVTLSLDSANIAENGGVATFTATLSNPSTETVTVNLGLTGSASGGGTDYNASGNSIVIAPLATSGTITVTAVDDLLDEPNESVIVDITGVTNGTEDGVQQQTTTIVDDDAPPTVTLSVDNGNIAENGGVATVTATLNAPSALPVTVNLGFTGTATGGGTDYTASGNQIVIPAGSLSGNITQTAVDDTVFEGDETIITDITGVTNGTENGTQQVTVTIDENEPAPTLSIDNVSLNEGNSGTIAFTFTVTLSQISANTVTVQADTADGSASAGSDYTAVSGQTLTFNPGDTTETVTVNVTGDTDSEPDETFTVNLSNPSGAGINDGQGDGTILNDDSSLSGPNVVLDQATVDFGVVDVGQTSRRTLGIGNDGDAELIVVNLNITGPDAALFSIVSSNCDIVPVDGSCNVVMDFAPNAEADFTATLNFDSNDPDTPSSAVPLTGAGGDDNDGATDAEEDAVPNPDGGTDCDPNGTGDGNCDGIPDSEQDNVASHPTRTGDGYVTVVSEDGTRLTNVSTDVQPDSDGLNNFAFPIGFFGFQVDDVPPGTCTKVIVIMDDNASGPFSGQAGDFYFKFGPTPSNPTDHFYRFDYDGETGARSITVEGQDAIELNLCDGKRGDHDLAANGSIEDPGGPAVATSAGGGGGGVVGDDDDDDETCFLGICVGAADPLTLVLFGLFGLWRVARFSHHPRGSGGPE